MEKARGTRAFLLQKYALGSRSNRFALRRSVRRDGSTSGCRQIRVCGGEQDAMAEVPCRRAVACPCAF